MEPTVSNPNIDTTPVADDKPVHFLDEARTHYIDSEPPFVSRNVGRNANGNVKHVVLATTDGKYPQVPAVVDCVHRLWSKAYTYATVDLNGKRRIVKSRSGGPNGGASYLSKSFNPISLFSFKIFSSLLLHSSYRSSRDGNANFQNSMERCPKRLR